MSFNKDERVKIWSDIKSLCGDDMQKECEDKLQKLFGYGNHDLYFDRLQDAHYILEPFTSSTNDNYIENMDTVKVVFTLLDALEEYEYFNKHVKINKKDYDYTKIRKKFEEIEPLLLSDSKITLRVPIHPNYIYNDTLHTLIEDGNIKRIVAMQLLNTLYGIDKKPPQTKQAKQEIKNVIDILERILSEAEKEGHDKDDIEHERTEIMKLKKYL